MVHAQNMSSFWRASNQSYLKYVNIASAMVRRVLKEPFKTKSKFLDDTQFQGARIGPDGKVVERSTYFPRVCLRSCFPALLSCVVSFFE